MFTVRIRLRTQVDESLQHSEKHEFFLGDETGYIYTQIFRIILCESFFQMQFYTFLEPTVLLLRGMLTTFSPPIKQWK